MEKTIIYAVSSLRDYGDGEIYFSTDGLFATKEMANAFIRQDITEVMENYREVFGEKIPDEEIKHTMDDTGEYRIDFCDHTFIWRIDEFHTEKFMPSKEVLRYA